MPISLIVRDLDDDELMVIAKELAQHHTELGRRSAQIKTVDIWLDDRKCYTSMPSQEQLDINHLCAECVQDLNTVIGELEARQWHWSHKNQKWVRRSELNKKKAKRP